jgi:hypothetical protein
MIVKIGGSVGEKINEIIEELKNAGKNILIVPGGWIFADLVRDVDGMKRLKPSISHWMAIAAMEIYAHYISNFGVKVIEVDTAENIEISGVGVLLPYGLLRKCDELPHSWDVTSDSVAVWVASKLGSKVVKITDVDGIYLDGELIEEVDASFLMKRRFKHASMTFLAIS